MGWSRVEWAHDTLGRGQLAAKLESFGLARMEKLLGEVEGLLGFLLRLTEPKVEVVINRVSVHSSCNAKGAMILGKL